MDYITKIKDILFLDGRKYADDIRHKQPNERKLWEKAYLWFHDNFELIIIVGGSILLIMLLFNYLDEDGSCYNRPAGNKKHQHQKGGQGKSSESDSSSASENTATPVETTKKVDSKNTSGETLSKPETTLDTSSTAKQETSNNKNKPDIKTTGFVGKTQAQIDADTEIEAAKQRAADRIAGKLKPEKTTIQKMRAKFLSKKAETNITNAKEAIKGAPGKVFVNVASKTSSAWKSVKSGEALELGKEKLENVVGDAAGFAKKHSKSGYVFLFTTFMVIGFGLFFVPTLIMFVIGAVTLMIFNKQKMDFLGSV